MFSFNNYITCAVTLLINTAFITTPTDNTIGETLYRKNCMRCHGADGTKGLWGARNLQKSNIPDAAIFRQIMNGSGPMPAFRKKFSEEEVNNVASYIKGLRKM